MKYEDWIKYEEARMEDVRKTKNSRGPGELMEATYREGRLLEVLLQQQGLIDALKAQVTSLQPKGK